jgi:hypothetical protein
MGGTDACPWCHTPIPIRSGRGRPRIWCSTRCKNICAKLGGPAGAADHLERSARLNDSAAEAFDSASCRARAAELRAAAERLRRLV